MCMWRQMTSPWHPHQPGQSPCKLTLAQPRYMYYVVCAAVLVQGLLRRQLDLEFTVLKRILVPAAPEWAGRLT